MKELNLLFNPRTGRYMSTTSRSSQLGDGQYDFVRVQGRIFIGPRPGTAPLYHAFRSGPGNPSLTMATHYDEDKAWLELMMLYFGPLGYVHAKSQSGTIPLKLYRNLDRGTYLTVATPEDDRLATTSAYIFDSIEGHIYPPETAEKYGAIPIILPEGQRDAIVEAIKDEVSKAVTGSLQVEWPESFRRRAEETLSESDRLKGLLADPVRKQVIEVVTTESTNVLANRIRDIESQTDLSRRLGERIENILPAPKLKHHKSLKYSGPKNLDTKTGRAKVHSAYEKESHAHSLSA